MIHIQKASEPATFTDWKSKNPNFSFKDLQNPQKSELRQSFLVEQGYICCFCGKSIDDNNLSQKTRIAHLIPQSINPNLALTYTNMYLSCATPDTCDIAQKNQIIPIGPDLHDCHTYFSFSITGKISENKSKQPSDQKEAYNTIQILNLNALSLIEKRKRKINTVLKNIKKIKNNPNIKNQQQEISKIFENVRKKINGKHTEFYFAVLISFNKL